VKGVSPAELARSFEGRHISALQWQKSESGSPDAGFSPVNDEIALDITYRGENGATHCDADLKVEVAIEITTRDTGIHEMGIVTLWAPSGSSDLSAFGFAGVRVDAHVALRRSGGAVEISGSLQSLAGDLPGDSAEFPPNDNDSGIGGGP
jgi:hypothetical protein